MVASPIRLNPYRDGPILCSPTSTAPSNEAGRFLIINRHVSAVILRLCTELPTFQLEIRVGGFEGFRKNRCLLNVLIFSLLLCRAA